jgi:hypothetical protein
MAPSEGVSLEGAGQASSLDFRDWGAIDVALGYNVRLLASQDVCIHIISFRHDVQLPVPQDVCIHIMSETLRLKQMPVRAPCVVVTPLERASVRL